MFFSELPMGLNVCFVEGMQQVGKQRTYPDPSRVYDILRAAKASQEDHQAVEYALRERRPGSVELNLSQEQYERLRRG
jgi:hypothetical protein